MPRRRVGQLSWLDGVLKRRGERRPEPLMEMAGLVDWAPFERMLDGIHRARKGEAAYPPLMMFKVLLLNDDYTPMDFVVVVLQKFFALSREKATQVMLKVHREGIGVCGVYPRDVAATKVEQVKSYSKQHQHPLQCVMEEM